jgi:DnaK suppressor protein
MAKKIVKPAKKASKPAPKKTAAKPAPKKVAKPVAKKVAKPASKKVAKPAPKPAKKAMKPAPKPAAKKAVAKKPLPKPVTKKPVNKAAPKKAAPAPKKVEKKAATPVVAKKVEKAPKAEPKKAAKELIKDKKAGKPIDAVAKKSALASKKAGKPSKGKKGDDDEEEEDSDVEEEEEDDSDVDVKDDYEKPEDDDDAVIDSDLDGPPVLDLEGGGIPLDDDDDDEIPEKRGRGRRKKNEGRVAGSESYIRNRPLHIDITKPLIKKPQAAQPKPFVNTKDDRSRYSDKELLEFKELILDKLKEAQMDFDLLKQTLSNADNHGTDDTSPSFKLLEDGSDVLSKEETAQLAIRQEKYIVNLKNALMRIENKTYGICRVTGKLIPKERLRSVPHATLGIDAKLNQ